MQHAVRISLTPVDCCTRAAWCPCHVPWTRQQWSTIPFTDDSPASLLLSMMAGDVLGSENVLRMFHWICCSGGWSLWRQISNISTSVVENIILIYWTTSFRDLWLAYATGTRLCTPSSSVLYRPYDQVPHFAGQQCHSWLSSEHHRFLATCSPDLACINFWTTSS